ncbi:hypothetical protein BH747_00200 [Enterococcus villorum]|uniref:Uncharacterized protein n=2 Tax=Enterococcus villorum TaxID=112904 RepID=A0A1V8YF91_9ENTE|nr:hypothetical protein BH747_00200 [Enterococcus villorum]OQO73526.1 hypothetical protein BH744_09950 [Enterococcus villorum]
MNQINNTYKHRNNDFYKAMNKGKVEKESKSESDDLQEISQLLHLNTNFEKNYRQINPLDTLQKKRVNSHKKQE